MPLTIATMSTGHVVKENTAVSHQEVEQILLPVLQQLSSKEAYANVLRMFYGYFYPLEVRIQQLITTADLPDISQRRIAGSALSDLVTLGYASVPPLCQSLPLLTHKAEAFGALYVLEGSTLGGRVITKMLLKNEMFPVPTDALQFFSGYGVNTGNMWSFFLETLNRQTDVDAISDAANETFLHLKYWMESCLYESTNKF